MSPALRSRGRRLAAATGAAMMGIGPAARYVPGRVWLRGVAVVRSHRDRPWMWGLAGAGILAAAVLLLMPGAASAGILDFLFGGFQQPQAPSPPSSYADAPAAPSRRAPDGTREDGGGGGGGGGGRYVAY